jgi:RNA polymerase sigma-70 factor (ECF subfamily)
MHEDVHRADEGSRSATQAPLPLPLDFEAHYLMNQEAWHSYALYRLASNAAAERAVHRAFLEVLRNWDALLTEANLPQQTWSILRRVVGDEALSAAREELTTLPSGIGLYAALRKLPQRQLDVIVLRYVLRYSSRKTGWYLGITASTVDHHCRKARERLAPVYHNSRRRQRAEPAEPGSPGVAGMPAIPGTAGTPGFPGTAGEIPAAAPLEAAGDPGNRAEPVKQREERR